MKILQKSRNFMFSHEKSKKKLESRARVGCPGGCKTLYNSNVLGAPGAGGPSRDPIYPNFTNFNEF